MEKPSGRVTYIVVLEGLCRFSVQELSTRGTYYVARINRLDLTKAGEIFYHSVTCYIPFNSLYKCSMHTSICTSLWFKWFIFLNRLDSTNWGICRKCSLYVYSTVELQNQDLEFWLPYFNSIFAYSGHKVPSMDLETCCIDVVLVVIGWTSSGEWMHLHFFWILSHKNCLKILTYASLYDFINELKLKGSWLCNPLILALQFIVQCSSKWRFDEYLNLD